MTRWIRPALILAALALLLANGACALGGLQAQLDPNPLNDAGAGAAIAGMLAFYAGVPLGILAIVLVLAKRQERAPVLAGLFLLALVGAAIFGGTLLARRPDVFDMRTLPYLVVFLLGTGAAGAALVVMRRGARPRSPP